MHDTSLETLFIEAVERLPFPDLQKTSHAQGSLETAESGRIEYSEEVTFSAGSLCHLPIEGGGWIDFVQEDDTVTISALFSLARNGDWQDGRILPESQYICGSYNTERKEWSFEFEMI